MELALVVDIVMKECLVALQELPSASAPDSGAVAQNACCGLDHGHDSFNRISSFDVEGDGDWSRMVWQNCDEDFRSTTETAKGNEIPSITRNVESRHIKCMAAIASGDAHGHVAGGNKGPRNKFTSRSLRFRSLSQKSAVLCVL